MVDNYTQKGIPLENVFLDIPYMDNFTDFTVNKKAFPDIKKFADNLHNNRQRLTVILDAGVSADDRENKYYKRANELDILIKSSMFGDAKAYNGSLVMKVWPNKTVFIDWLHPQAGTFWSEGLLDLYKQVPFDGLWIDMNEATGFNDGELDTSKEEPPKPPTPPTPPPPTPDQPNLQEEIKEQVKRFLIDYQDEWYKSFPQDEPSTWYLPFVPGYNQ